MDSNGDLIENYTYEEDGFEYYLTDMIEFGGRVYLSAYTAPDHGDAGGRSEIAAILDYIFSNGLYNVTDEELTPLVRDNFTAVLLVCDPESVTPETFYSVKGSLGMELSMNDSGELEWETWNFVSAHFSPATSAYSIACDCKVFRNTFDEEGTLIDSSDTGKIEWYRR